jgi:hypothetical protein
MLPMVAMAGAQMGMGAAQGLIAAIPGKQEKAIKQQLANDERKLALGKAMSDSQMDAARASQMGAVNAKEQQMLAQMARGSADGGASGMQQANIASVLQGGAQAARSVASDVNRLNRASLDVLKADVMGQRANVAAMKQQNLNKGMDGLKQVAGGMGSMMTEGVPEGAGAQGTYAVSGGSLVQKYLADKMVSPAMPVPTAASLQTPTTLTYAAPSYTLPKG